MPAPKKAQKASMPAPGPPVRILLNLDHLF
jgi:hypothetical protein